ncbi:uroporphyrinogen-III C-methyltransferase [Catellatospora sp. IY07-71]|uniref:uroporphyrinogen-III C-methyltransferase n=1 Tax=Catellatospora sp. IY07-71 TaxID=2728827 RepID=UPI001BB2FA60|nr:uroporphyrinogen-III C-methyltransferase [Catellatospora sp. IY07-71]BCJ70604.1 uroporphyrinogen-III C-methyltransferase [Catellatospora sp. IY07-71]
MSDLYPLALRLDGRPVLVVGGGAVATRRVPALLAAGAAVRLVSPELTPALRGLADAGRLAWIERQFAETDLDGVWLVQVAVDDPEAAAAVSAAAERRKIFCVRADDRHAASAWTPAVARHGAVTVAVLAGGEPRRAVAVRDRIASLLATDEATVPDSVKGTVALVGGGPGDPELITVKGRRLLAAADVVVADRLAPGLLLDELRADVELVDVAKLPYGPAAQQEEINRILVERAKAGLFVVRLKGGDSYVFGRGGEEVLACAEAGVPVTVVPGVTSAISVPAAAGVPVTHRRVAHEFTVLSGHIGPEHPDSLVDWAALARMRGTLVILMGLKNLPAITAALLAHGRDGATPAAIIQEGTTSQQRSVHGTLAELPAMAKSFDPPAIVVIGSVVDVLPRL